MFTNVANDVHVLHIEKVLAEKPYKISSVGHIHVQYL